MSNYYEIYMNDELIASSENNEGILNPIINKEINTAGSCSFTVLPSHPKWGEFRRYASFIDVFIYDVCVFRGRITTISMDSFKQKSIECEGALAFLMDTNFGAIQSKNIRDKIGTVLQTHNGCCQVDLDPNRTGTNIYGLWYPWDYRRCFKTGIVEPEGSRNILDHPVYDGWYVGEIGSDNLPYRNESGTRLLYELNGVSSDKTYTFCFDNLQYSVDYPNEQIIFYFYGDNGYINKYTTNLSFFNTQAEKHRAFTLSGAGVASATSAVISIPAFSKRYGTRFWLQEDDTESRNYALSEHYSETTEHEITGDGFSTLFIQNRDAMIRTRPLCMDKLFLRGIERYTPIEDKAGSYIDVLNPRRIVNSKRITFGVNLLELQEESPDFEPVVAVRPLHDGNSFWETNSAGTSVPYIIENPHFKLWDDFRTAEKNWEYAQESGYPRTVKVLEVGENATKDSATKRVKYYFESLSWVVPISFKVKALDTSIYSENTRINPGLAASMVDVGDPVMIVAEPYDLPEGWQYTSDHTVKNIKVCLALKLDILNPQNNEYTIGDYIPEGDDFEAETLTKKFANEKKKKKK